MMVCVHGRAVALGRPEASLGREGINMCCSMVCFDIRIINIIFIRPSMRSYVNKKRGILMFLYLFVSFLLCFISLKSFILVALLA